MVSEKIQKNSKIPIFNQNGNNKKKIGGISWYFPETELCKELVFFCFLAISVSGRFFLAFKSSFQVIGQVCLLFFFIFLCTKIAHLVTTSKNYLHDCLIGQYHRFFLCKSDLLGPWHPIFMAFFFFSKPTPTIYSQFTREKKYIKPSLTINALNLLVYLGWQYSTPKLGKASIKNPSSFYY